MPQARKPEKRWDTVTQFYVYEKFMVLGQVVHGGNKYMASDRFSGRELGVYESVEDAKQAVEQAFEDFDVDSVPLPNGEAGQ